MRTFSAPSRPKPLCGVALLTAIVAMGSVALAVPKAANPHLDVVDGDVSTRFVTEHWGVRDGLPAVTVSDITQDDD